MPKFKNNFVYWGHWLIIDGHLAGFSIGEQRYFPESKGGRDFMTYGDAVEGAKSNALMRLCKGLGISIELWKPSFVRDWKAKHAVSFKDAQGKTVWKRKDAVNGKAPVAHSKPPVDDIPDFKVPEPEIIPSISKPDNVPPAVPPKYAAMHSWIESFPTELESFQSYAKVYPKNVILLVDTYATLLSGLPSAIQVGNELRARKEGDLLGIRLDSGDLTFLSREARKLLDEAGFHRTRILGSSDLDEWLIDSIKKQGAEIDLWGVGTRMVTSYSCPALGGVYKLSAILEDGGMKPKLKVSDDPEKTTNPGVKKVIRFFDEKNFMRGDVLFFEDEVLPGNRPIRALHPMLAHVHKTYPPGYKREDILIPIFQGGKRIYSLPPLADIQARTLQNLHYLRPEHKRLQNPHIYHISLGEKLFQQKQELIKEAVG